MTAVIRTHFIASVIGGLVVAGAFLVLGITGRRTTRTIVEEAPVSAQPASSSTSTSSLTPTRSTSRTHRGWCSSSKARAAARA